MARPGLSSRHVDPIFLRYAVGIWVAQGGFAGDTLVALPTASRSSRACRPRSRSTSATTPRAPSPSSPATASTPAASSQRTSPTASDGTGPSTSGCFPSRSRRPVYGWWPRWSCTCGSTRTGSFCTTRSRRRRCCSYPPRSPGARSRPPASWAAGAPAPADGSTVSADAPRALAALFAPHDSTPPRDGETP